MLATKKIKTHLLNEDKRVQSFQDNLTALLTSIPIENQFYRNTINRKSILQKYCHEHMKHCL